MTLTRPFVTRRFIAYAGDAHSHMLSLAVSVIDGFTGKQANAPLRVYLKELRRARLLRSQSGLFCFEELRAGNYTLVVEPDPTTADWFYLKPRPNEGWTEKFERPITLPLPDPLSPLETVTLSPKSSYPFPANSTLVRGTVTRGAANVSVAGAVISTTYSQVNPNDVGGPPVVVAIETQSDRDGEYVLFFQKLPGKTQPVVVTGVKDGQQVQQPVPITEGTMTKADPLHFP
jgi:hypothetical protein